MRTYKYCDVTKVADVIHIRWTDRAAGEQMLAELDKVYPFKYLDEKDSNLKALRDYGTRIGKFGGFMDLTTSSLAFGWIVRYLCNAGWEPMQLSWENSPSQDVYRGTMTNSRAMTFRYENNEP